MLKNIALALLGSVFGRPARHRTLDSAMAFTYRMPAGIPGDVNRTHPCNIEPCLMDPDDPPTFYGQAVVVDSVTQAVRTVLAGDGAIANIYGITARPYPIQQQSGGMTSDFGPGSVPTDQPVDVMRWGYQMVSVSGDTDPVKGGKVYVRIAASAGSHVQGGFEAAADGGNTILLPAASWNGSPDADGNAEIIFGVGTNV